jgi:predicted GNAT family acetyltransferase
MIPSGVATSDGKALWNGISKSESLEKGFRGLAASMVLGAAAMVPASVGNVTLGPDQSVQDTPMNRAPELLHPHLKHIAVLESSGGKNVNHKLGPDDYWTAHGPLGIKPAFAHDEYKRTPGLQLRFPGLTQRKDFVSAFKTYPSLYNAVANTAWSRLLSRFNGDARRAAYAWSKGEHAELHDRKAGHPKKYLQDLYVQRFARLMSPIQSHPKMALNKALTEIEVPQAREEDGRYDYSHLLPERLSDKGFRLLVDSDIENGEGSVEGLVTLKDPEANHPYEYHVGRVEARLHPDQKLHVIHSKVDSEHRDKGLATAAYEGVLAHAKNALGATHATGGVHSSISDAVHRKLAAKHGLKYYADFTGTNLPPPSGEDPGAYDDVFDGYEYQLE